MMTNTAAAAAASVCAKNPQRQDHHPDGTSVTELRNGCSHWGQDDPIRIPYFPSSTQIALDEGIDMGVSRPGVWDDWEWDFGWEGSVGSLWASVGLRQNPLSDSGE
jgi:hypothetical protein